jgi:hypothetical protein
LATWTISFGFGFSDYLTMKGTEFIQKSYFFLLRFFRLFNYEGVLNLSKSTISFGLGFSDYLIMRGIEICTKVTMILASE